MVRKFVTNQGVAAANKKVTQCTRNEPEMVAEEDRGYSTALPNQKSNQPGSWAEHADVEGAVAQWVVQRRNRHVIVTKYMVFSKMEDSKTVGKKGISLRRRIGGWHSDVVVDFPRNVLYPSCMSRFTSDLGLAHARCILGTQSWIPKIHW